MFATFVNSNFNVYTSGLIRFIATSNEPMQMVANNPNMTAWCDLNSHRKTVELAAQ